MFALKIRNHQFSRSFYATSNGKCNQRKTIFVHSAIKYSWFRCQRCHLLSRALVNYLSVCMRQLKVKNLLRNCAKSFKWDVNTTSNYSMLKRLERFSVAHLLAFRAIAKQLVNSSSILTVYYVLLFSIITSIATANASLRWWQRMPWNARTTHHDTKRTCKPCKTSVS